VSSRIAIVAAATACSRQPAVPAATPDKRCLDAVQHDFVESTFKAQPFFAVYSGRHESIGQMPDLSKSGIEAEIARLTQRARGGCGLRRRDASERNASRDYVLAVIDNGLF
jgi:hypothetical protein